MSPEEREIHLAHSTWIDAVNAGDLTRLLTLITDDVVFLNPGNAPMGRDGFASNFLAAKQRIRFRCVSELEEVFVVGEFAFARSRDTLSVTAINSGELTQLAGHRLTIYRRDSQGGWLLARDAHTLTPMAQ